MKIITLFCILLTTAASAQHHEAMEKIESARIALITERLDLTTSEAEKFWPLYREYNEKRKQLRQEFITDRKALREDNLSEEESKILFDKGIAMKEKQLELEKTYADKFVTVISNKQLLQLRKAEEDFRQMLLERLERRRDHGSRSHRRK